MSKLPVALVVTRLLPYSAKGRGVIYVASSEQRAESIAHLLRELSPEATSVFLPAWDCLPYDRASPAPDILGQQLAACRLLDEAQAGDASVEAFLVTTLEAAVQRLPPAAAASEVLILEPGDDIRPDVFKARLDGFGFRPHGRVDDHGEVAIRGEVIDIFPAGSTPYRLTIENGRVAAIHAYDPTSQRTTAVIERLVIDPVSPVIALPDAEPVVRYPGMEHWLPDYLPGLRTIFDLLPGAALMIEPGAEARLDEALALAANNYRDSSASAAARSPGARKPLPPEALYLTPEEWRAEDEARRIPLAVDEPTEVMPRFYTDRQPRRRLADFVTAKIAAGQRVVLAGVSARDRAALAKAIDAVVAMPPVDAACWAEVEAAAPGTVARLALSAEHGFIDADAGIVLVAAADLLGGGAERAAHHHHHAVAVPWHCGDGEFALGDTVIHIEHGVGVLRSLETLHSDGAGSRDTVRLDYAKEADLLAPIEALDRLWRYGSAGDAIRLDRLDSDAWSKRRQRIAGEIAETARGLVALARARAETAAPSLKAPPGPYKTFSTGFRFSPTPDQAQAIAAVIDDLAAGRPMDRLVVGDVGFGKTEVALRAAAVAVLAGRQVALVAPTTVLARQHVQTFTRRFAELGVEVGHLSRLTPPAEADRVRAGLADGSLRIVVGTHSVAAESVRFADLGLVIVDEEQRFGTAEKAKLRGLGKGIHVLTLTATPIPRTLEAALVGLQDLSIMATPPARRRPIRTLVAPYDVATLRTALLREKARNGQSFVVVPRIAALEPLAAALAEALPELTILSAHGRMAPEEVDDALVSFAEGQGDVLVATSIVESGLDVPRANTMVVCDAELFGMAQLHQLRGRVGRGRLQGICYLMTGAGETLSEAAAQRLQGIAALDRLGAGMAIAARDLDLRGAGDLVGEEQAGHLRLIGLGLYQHLLGLAIREAQGEAVEDWAPEISIDRPGSLPVAYIPEAEMRLNLYVRLARISDLQQVVALGEELGDRFGPPPPEVEDLLSLAKLRALCRTIGVARVDAGPKAIAFSLRHHVQAADLMGRASLKQRSWLSLKGDRLVYARASDTSRERLDLASHLLEAFV